MNPKELDVFTQSSREHSAQNVDVMHQPSTGLEIGNNVHLHFIVLGLPD
jgi:hypothetical protein